MNKDEIFNSVNKMLKDVTPLKCDCGQLCDKNCCKGDNTTGMLLFPGEKSNLNTVITDNGIIAVCNGNCCRDERPLSCMIFPFFPLINENGKIKAVIDYRGYGICPMIKNSDFIKFNRKFIKTVEKAGKLLYTDTDIKEFMISKGNEILEYQSYINKFIQDDNND